jgi:hypothetical protein
MEKDNQKYVVYIKNIGFIKQLFMPIKFSKFTADVEQAQQFLDVEYLKEKLRGVSRFDIVTVGEARIKYKQFGLSKQARLYGRINKILRNTRDVYNLNNDKVINDLTNDILEVIVDECKG